VGLRILAASFPLILLFFATTFQLGGTGFWADDYWLNQRSPITGERPPLLEDGRLTQSTLIINRGFFLRPLFYTVAPPLVTLTWHADWLAHGVLVLAHGAVVLLLYRLMLRLGLARPPAAAASLLFMVYPMQYETLYWAAALPITLSALLMLVIFNLHAGLAFDRRRGRRLAILALLPFLGFAVCSLNEQPASGILAMPLLYVVALRRAGGAGGAAKPRVAGDAMWLLPALLAGSGVITYLFLMKVGLPPFIRPVPPGVRGAADSLVRPADLPRRTAELAESVWHTLWRSQFARGALIQGLRELRAAPVETAIFAVLLAASSAAWLKRPTNTAAMKNPQAAATFRGVGPAFAGAAVFIGGFVPILVVTIYIAAPRIIYWPAIGAAIAIAGLGNILHSRARVAGALGRMMRNSSAAALLPVLLIWSILLIGIAASFRARWEQDWSEGRQLRALVIDPPPGTCFIPLRVQSPCADTGQWRFDRHLQTVFAWPWTAPRFIRTIYGRDDVTAGSWRPWAQYAQAGDDEGLWYAGHLDGEFAEGGRLPWERVVPFIVTPDRKVRLITTIIITEEGGPDRAIDIPLARPVPGAQGSPAIERLEFRLPRG
jgi:hypothetical protein